MPPAGRSFDAVADCCEGLRPGHPTALVEGVVEFGQLDAQSRLLGRVPPSCSQHRRPRRRSSFLASAASPMSGSSAARRCSASSEHETFWHKTLSSAECCELCSAHSDHATLPIEPRARLLDAMRRVLDEHGGTITIDYRTGLFLARAVAR